MNATEVKKSTSEMIPDGTFRECGPKPQNERDRIDACELTYKARLLGPTFAETARLFCWLNGAGQHADLTIEAIDQFCATLPQIGKRHPTSAQHFELSAEAAIDLAQAQGLPPRDRSTIARHRHRLLKLLTQQATTFEDRIRENWLVAEPDEIARIAGWRDHSCFVLVERHCRIVFGAALLTFDRMRVSPKPKTFAGDLVNEAERLAEGAEEQGRAFAATRHHGELLLLAGFWQARGARDSPPKRSTPASET